MKIKSKTEALEILSNAKCDPWDRETAARYLLQYPSPEVMECLINTLRDEDFGVRYVAAQVLIDMRDLALPDLLRTLTDAHHASDTQLRETIRHILMRNRSVLQIRVDALLDALKGPVPGLAAMEEASKLLRQLGEAR
ncbi:MAG: HEAT repeat domain-containing protein [Chloroflexi bacterium]|nr:HEAT repeat domain-containing protein [Chloroflexota bacterium]